jgi:hypothetical protein
MRSVGATRSLLLNRGGVKHPAPSWRSARRRCAQYVHSVRVAEDQFTRLLSFIRRLDGASIRYTLSSFRDDSICVEVTARASVGKCSSCRLVGSRSNGSSRAARSVTTPHWKCCSPISLTSAELLIGLCTDRRHSIAEVTRTAIGQHGRDEQRVRVLNNSARELGVMSKGDAARFARAHDAELIDVDQRADPPVVAVVDFVTFERQHREMEHSVDRESKRPTPPPRAGLGRVKRTRPPRRPSV